jgi:predicted membrane GTPase involved in stress response
MQLNKVHSVKTIDRVAAELGETVDRIFDLTIEMETEDGVIWVYGPGDDSVIAFTPFGIENLCDLIEMDRENAR